MLAGVLLEGNGCLEPHALLLSAVALWVPRAGETRQGSHRPFLEAIETGYRALVEILAGSAQG
jgi:hypothetical protein